MKAKELVKLFSQVPPNAEIWFAGEVGSILVFVDDKTSSEVEGVKIAQFQVAHPTQWVCVDDVGIPRAWTKNKFKKRKD